MPSNATIQFVNNRYLNKHQLNISNKSAFEYCFISNDCGQFALFTNAA